MKNNPVRLSKPNERMTWEQRIAPYVPYILLTLLLILVLLVVALAMTVFGVSPHSITGTEANNYYYGLEGVV